jgi:motility quorum-sensing regulator/GCU-specific mRNA interferase toxin
MEKLTPHYKLAIVRSLIAAAKVGSTALASAAALGFDFFDMLKVVVGLKPADFHKSMTTHADHTVWQDVYRPMTSAGEVYLKLTIVDEVLIVSFKEL